MKFQEGSILKNLIFRLFKFPLGFIVDQTDNTMELVNEWFLTGYHKRSYTEEVTRNNFGVLPIGMSYGYPDKLSD